LKTKPIDQTDNSENDNESFRIKPLQIGLHILKERAKSVLETSVINP